MQEPDFFFSAQLFVIRKSCLFFTLIIHNQNFIILISGFGENTVNTSFY